MTRSLPSLTAFLLGSLLLGGCAVFGPDDGGAKVSGNATLSELENSQPTDLDGSVRKAQLLRVAGKYDEAIHILAQLMLVASDDARVVGEYGKTLAAQGRAQEAVQFLGRAVELKSNDWATYSALGVAYDQLGNQPQAKVAYEHALMLEPGEPSVLNNYALSRMLANDPATARQLIERAQIAGGASDPKIARNIALIDALAPAPQPPQGLAYAVTKPAPAAPVQIAAVAPGPFVKLNPLPPISPSPVAQTQPRIVMQAVPFDPLAGPIRVSANAGPVQRPAKAKTPKALAEAAPVQAPANIDAAKSVPDAAPVGPATHAPRLLTGTTAPKTAATVKPNKDAAAAAAETVVKKIVARDSERPKTMDKEASAKKLADTAPAPKGSLDKAPAAKAADKPAPVKALTKNAPPKDLSVPSLRLAADTDKP